MTSYHKELDKKVNNGETLRDFIKNSYKEFFGQELTDEQINWQSEEELRNLAEHLDRLWTK